MKPPKVHLEKTEMGLTLFIHFEDGKELHVPMNECDVTLLVDSIKGCLEKSTEPPKYNFNANFEIDFDTFFD